jgi:hypothetical protein
MRVTMLKVDYCLRIRLTSAKIDGIDLVGKFWILRMTFVFLTFPLYCIIIMTQD